MERQWPIVLRDYLPSSCLFSYHPLSSEGTVASAPLCPEMLGLGWGNGRLMVDKGKKRREEGG